MTQYIYSLLGYAQAGGKFIPVEGRPVTLDIIEQLANGLIRGNERRRRHTHTIHGTNTYMIRAGMVLEQTIDGCWQMLLGRACNEGEEIGPGSYLKTPGGYAKLALDIDNRDESILTALLREMREEGFNEGHSVLENSVSPLCMMTTPRHGILQFFSGTLERYPPGKRDGLTLFNTYKDKRILIRYFSISDFAEELAKGPGSVVRPETIDAAIASYFWQKSEKIYLGRRETGHDAHDGNIVIPKGLRRHMLKQAGMPTSVNSEFMRACKLFYSVPTQMEAVPAVRLIFMTDLFMTTRQFGPGYFTNAGRSAKLLAESAQKLAKKYLAENYEKIFSRELVRRYLKSK